MGEWRLEIYDNTNTTRQAVIPASDIQGGNRIEELNGEDTLDFSMDRGSTHWSTLDLRDIVRLVDVGANTSRSYRIRSIKDGRTGKSFIGLVQCEHIKYDMLAEIYTRWKPYVKADPDSVIDDILSMSSFSSSTITPATLMDNVANFGSVLENLEQVRETLNTDMIVNEDSTIKFAAHGSNNNVRIKYAKNMRGIERLQDVHEFFTKLYPFGAGEPPTTLGGNDEASLQGAEHIIETISGATMTLHDRMVVTNDSLNNLWAEITRANTVAAIGERKRILDSVANDTIVLATVFSGTVAVGDYLKIVSTASGGEVNFVKDQVNIDLFGTLEADLPLNEIAGIHNIALTPALDGVYSASANGTMPANWTELNITDAVGPNTTDTRFGNKSCSVSTDSAGEGIQQAVTLVDTEYYSLAVWVFISAGSVRVELFDGTATQPSGGVTAETTVTGTWVQINLEGVKAVGTAGIIKVLANSANSQYRVDAVVLEKKSRLTSPSEFSPISGARTMWDRGVDLLRQSNAPRKQYVVGVADLYEGDREIYQYEQFQIGDTITVQDDDLGIDITARVRRKEWDLFNPWNAKVQLDNFTDRVARQFRKNIKIFKREERFAGIIGGRTATERVVAGNNTQHGSTQTDPAE